MINLSTVQRYVIYVTVEIRKLCAIRLNIHIIICMYCTNDSKKGETPKSGEIPRSEDS